MKVLTLASATGLRIGQATTGVCPSSRDCLVRALVWAAVNFGTIAPVMT